MLTLYFAPHTCALASLIALEESGLPFKTKKLNFAEAEQRVRQSISKSTRRAGSPRL